MKYGYLTRSKPKDKWKPGKHYPMTEKQVKEAIKSEQQESKIVEWKKVLRIQGIKPKQILKKSVYCNAKKQNYVIPIVIVNK